MRVLSSSLAMQFPSLSNEYRYGKFTTSSFSSSIFLTISGMFSAPIIKSSASHQKMYVYSFGTWEKLKFLASANELFQGKKDMWAPYFLATASTSEELPVMVM